MRSTPSCTPSDGGLRWTPQVHVRSTCQALGVQALQPTTGLDRRSGMLLRTVDGGAAWTRVALPACRPEPVHFANAKDGWAGSAPRQTPGRSSTPPTVVATGGPALRLRAVSALSFADSQNGWAITGGERRPLPHDRRRRPLGSADRRPELRWVLALAAGGFVGGAAAYYGSLSRTTDGGTTWQPQHAARPATITATSAPCSSSTPATGWAVGGRRDPRHHRRRRHLDGPVVEHQPRPERPALHRRQTTAGRSATRAPIVHTTDGGANWTAQTSGTSYHSPAWPSPTPSDGWATGQSFTRDDYSSGVILHTTDGGQDWTHAVRLDRRPEPPQRRDRFQRRRLRRCPRRLGGRRDPGVDTGYNSFVIMHTTDGGATWTQQLDYFPHAGGNEDDATLTSVACTSAENAVAVGYDDNGAARSGARRTAVRPGRESGRSCGRCTAPRTRPTSSLPTRRTAGRSAYGGT